MFFLAMKHLFTRLNQTILTFLGITLGATGYIVFSGLQIGYRDMVVDRLVNVDAYVRISPRDETITKETFQNIFFPDAMIKWLSPPSGRVYNSYLSNPQGWYDRLADEPHVVAWSPQLLRDVLCSHEKFSQNIRLMGINPATQSRVTNIKKDITAGTLEAIGMGDSLVLIGEELMRRLGARMSDTITIVNSQGAAYPVKIAGTYNTGIKQLDQRLVYASLATVQKVSQSPGEISDIVVRLDDAHLSADLATKWQSNTTDKVESWDQSKADIRITLKTQNIVRQMTTFTIMVIIAFGIYNILNMVVNTKKREIAILRSMGYDQLDTIFLFLVQGVLLGIAGSIAGIIAGALFCRYIGSIKLEGNLGYMPMSWDIMIYVNAFVIVLLSSIVASFIPARNAGRLSPIDIIRNS